MSTIIKYASNEPQICKTKNIRNFDKLYGVLIFDQIHSRSLKKSSDFIHIWRLSRAKIPLPIQQPFLVSLIFFLVERELSNVNAFKEQLHSFVDEIGVSGKLAKRSKSLEVEIEVWRRFPQDCEDGIHKPFMTFGERFPTSKVCGGSLRWQQFFNFSFQACKTLVLTSLTFLTLTNKTPCSMSPATFPGVSPCC